MSRQTNAAALATGLGVAELPKESDDLRYWHNKHISWRHILVVQMHAAGFTNNQIAARLGYGAARVSVLLNDPRTPEILSMLASRVADALDDVHIKLRLIAPEAMQTAIEVMRESDDEKVRRDTAFGLLDRAGYGKVNKSVVVGAALSSDQVERLTKVLTNGDGDDDDAEEISYSIETEHADD